MHVRTSLARILCLHSIPETLLSVRSVFGYSPSHCIKKTGRWGVSPIVHVAQQEQTLEIPEELEIPWSAVKRHFRINGRGGNLSSNVYFAFNDSQKLEFSCCVGLSEDHKRTEHWTDYLFVGMEDLVSPE